MKSSDVLQNGQSFGVGMIEIKRSIASCKNSGQYSSRDDFANLEVARLVHSHVMTSVQNPSKGLGRDQTDY